MPDAAVPPSRPFKARLRRVAPYFRGTQWGFVLVFVGALLAAATEPLIPALMKPLLDSGFKAGRVPLWSIPVVLIGLFGVRGVAGFAAQYGLSWAANGGTRTLRTAMFGRLLDAAPGLYAAQNASTLTNTLTYQVQSGANELVSSLLSLVKESLTLAALLGYLMWLNWQLTLFVAIVIPGVAIAMRTLSRRLHRLTVAAQGATDRIAYVVEENVLAWRTVRLHGAEPAQRQRFAAASDALRRLSIKSVVAAATMTPVTQVFAAAAFSTVIMAAVWQSTHSGASVGGFVAFVTAMLLLVAPIKHLSEVAAPISRGLAALDRGVALIEDVPVEHGGGHDPGRARGELELRDVSLHYPGGSHPGLDGVSLRLRAGESVALVGPSGAGKSTFVNLLPRFVEPTAGTVLLDGVPLAEWNVAALRRQFALVSQDVVLFNDTLAENVRLGAPVRFADAFAQSGALPIAAVAGATVDPDRQRVRDALQAANLLDFADGLPLGLDTLVGHNGSKLSGGQRQRLAIARAIYKDAPILLLDEATSALDSESERLVQDALDVLMQGRTSLVVAHRLGTVEHCDRIVVLEAGRVADQGTHAELLQGGGLYRRLHALQFRA